jgi:hypothetical protein
VEVVKWSEMVRNGQKWSKMVKNDRNGRIRKMAKNDRNGRIMKMAKEMVFNCPIGWIGDVESRVSEAE